MAAKPEKKQKVAADNRRARFNYELGEVFEAIIISAWKDGYGVELTEHFIEGFIPLVELPKRQFRPGDRLKVQVARIDKLLRRAYFSSPDHDRRRFPGRRRE